jgi:hypothetical protein
MSKAKSKRIPVSAAQDIGKKFNKDQVILVTWDEKSGDTWVTTWGSNRAQCVMAAKGGDFVKEALGWPNHLTQTKSASEKFIRKNVLAQVKLKLQGLDKDNYIGLDTIAVRDINQALKELE